MSVASVVPIRSPEHAPPEPSRDGAPSGNFESSLMDILDSGARLHEERAAEQEERPGREPRDGKTQNAAEGQRVEDEQRSDEDQRSDEPQRIEDAQRVDENAVGDTAAELELGTETPTETSLAADTLAPEVGNNPTVTDELLEQILERTREYLSSPDSNAGAREGSGRTGQAAPGTQPIQVESRNLEPAPPAPETRVAPRDVATQDSRDHQRELSPEFSASRNPQQTAEQGLERPAVGEPGSAKVQPDNSARSLDTEAGELRDLKAEQVVKASAEPQSDLGDDRREHSRREEASAREGGRGPRSTTAPSVENLVESERVRTATASLETQLEPSVARGATNLSALPIEVAVGAPSDAAAPSAPASAPRPMPPEAIPQHIEWLVARGGGRAEIQLHPPELGRLSIQVIVRGGDVQIVMNVQEGAAQTIVAEYRESLETSLAAKDLKLDQFEVRDWSNRDDPSARGDRDSAASERDRESQKRDGQDAPRGIAGALMQPARGNDAASGDDRINLRV